MKKIYSAPRMQTVKIQLRNHLLDLSTGGTASIMTDNADGDAFSRESNGWDIWSSSDDDVQ